MLMRLLLAAAGSALLVAGSSAGATPRRAAAPARVDWTRSIVATPQGGFRMGNPAAMVKLVEYASISCPHCGRFARESGTLRSDYVRSGKVSLEYRPFVIFPTDPGIFMLLRCQRPAAFFTTTDRLYADQMVWEDKVQALPAERVTEIQAMTPKARIAALTQASGVESYFRQAGMTAARASACLADDRNLAAVLATSQRGNKEGVRGTPTFFINGKLTAAGDWAALEPLLKSAGG
jgi:protein-disulfide isomerase